MQARPFLLCFAVAIVPASASAQLLGPPRLDAGEELDPEVKDGDAIARAAPPDARGWGSACSFRYATCVHTQPGPAAGGALVALASLERAWEAQSALRIPLPDGGEGGAYHVYLVDRGDAPPSSTLVYARDVRSHIDRAAAFSLVDRSLTGCALDVALARELARASIYRMAPGTDEATARAEASYVARFSAPCAMSLPDGVDAFQSYPERALADEWLERPGRTADAYARGAALFPWWLDFSFGEQPADFLRGFWSVCPTETPEGAARWRAHPAAYDVLHTTFAGAFGPQSSVDDLYVRFAVARAFMGSADDGAHLPETRALGDAARVSMAWPDVAWPTEPRAFASADAVSQTGAAYLLVHHDGAPADAKLQVEAKWEAFTRMRWIVIKLDADGRDAGESVLGGFDRGTDARVMVSDLAGAKDLLVVGVSLGDRKHRYDPNDGASWAHGWVVTLYPK